MSRYIAARTASGVGVVAGLLIIAFFATHYIGDPVFLLVNDEFNTPEDRALLIEQGGFDRPVWEQFWDFSGGAIRGDFGDSVWQHRPASEVVIERLPATLALAGSAAVVAFAVAVPAAVVGARYAGRWPDVLITTVATALASFTSFWLALLLILVFAVQLGWLPTSGYGFWPELILPSLALAAPATGHITQILQSSLRTEFGNQYVRTARSKGLGEGSVALRHVLPNAGLVGITMLGSLLTALMSSAVLIEAIFAWPGLGQASLQAIQQRDLPVLMAAVLVIGTVVTVVNVVVDLLYVRLDPRVRLR